MKKSSEFGQADEFLGWVESMMACARAVGDQQHVKEWEAVRNATVREMEQVPRDRMKRPDYTRANCSGVGSAQQYQGSVR